MSLHAVCDLTHSSLAHALTPAPLNQQYTHTHSMRSVDIDLRREALLKATFLRDVLGNSLVLSKIESFV